MAALARLADDVPRRDRIGAHENANGLRALLFEDIPGDAYAIGCALRENPRILSITRVTAGRALKVIDAQGVVPDFAICSLQPLSEGGFAMIVALGAKLRDLYADPAAFGMPVITLTMLPPLYRDAANTNAVEFAARLDGIISEVVPRAQRN